MHSEGAIYHVTIQSVGQRRADRSFVEAGIAETDEEFRELLKASRWGIGDAAFQAQVRDLHTARAQEARRPEDASFRRVERPVPADRVLEAVSGAFGVDAAVLRQRQDDCVARAVAALLVGRYAGMHQRDIGVWLGMGTGSAVCRQLGRWRERSARHAVLKKQIGCAEAAIQAAGREAAAPEMSNIKG